MKPRMTVTSWLGIDVMARGGGGDVGGNVLVSTRVPLYKIDVKI